MPASGTDDHVRIQLLAVPESSASVLYGLYDVLNSVGRTWHELTGQPELHRPFDVSIVAPQAALFRCQGGLPVVPDAALETAGPADIAIVTDLAYDLREDPRGRWPEAVRWLQRQDAHGATLCSVCSGLLLMADSGLMDGIEAATHWAALPAVRQYYPLVQIKPERILVVGGPDRRRLSCGGASAWEDMALYIVQRFRSRAEAIRTAKIFLLGDRSEGQLPYAALPVRSAAGDGVIADCQAWIAQNYDLSNPVGRMVERSGLPERTFKRRFRRHTGMAAIDYVQSLRVEEAKQHLEESDLPTETVAREVGYEDVAYFRRLFQRLTGTTPGRYRRRYRSLGRADPAEPPHGGSAARPPT